MSGYVYVQVPPSPGAGVSGISELSDLSARNWSPCLLPTTLRFLVHCWLIFICALTMAFYHYFVYWYLVVPWTFCQKDNSSSNLAVLTLIHWKLNCPQMSDFISKFLVLWCLSIHLSLCWHYTISITAAVHYISKLICVIPLNFKFRMV